MREVQHIVQYSPSFAGGSKTLCAAPRWLPLVLAEAGSDHSLTKYLVFR